MDTKIENSHNLVMNNFSFNTIKQKRKELEVGRICLDIYDDIKDKLKALGIGIMLNICEGTNVYIKESPTALKLCLHIMIYCFVRFRPTLRTFVISVEERENRIWIVFYAEDSDEETLSVDEILAEKKDENLARAIYLLKRYILEHEILPLFTRDVSIWKLGMGFKYVDRR